MQLVVFVKENVVCQQAIGQLLSFIWQDEILGQHFVEILSSVTIIAK